MLILNVQGGLVCFSCTALFELVIPYALKWHRPQRVSPDASSECAKYLLAGEAVERSNGKIPKLVTHIVKRLQSCLPESVGGLSENLRGGEMAPEREKDCQAWQKPGRGPFPRPRPRGNPRWPSGSSEDTKGVTGACAVTPPCWQDCLAI